MKRNTFLCCSHLLFGIFSSPAISQGKTAFGINAGIGICRMMSVEEARAIIRYEYPISYSVGIAVENPLSDRFSIVNELRYQNSITTVVSAPFIGYTDEKVVMKKLIVPVLVKYQASWLGETYFLLGPSVGYLIKANYTYDPDSVYPYHGSAEITKDLPAIQAAVELGIGKGIKISGGELKFELRGEWGFTRFRYAHQYPPILPPNIGSWRNAGLNFVIGYALN